MDPFFGDYLDRLQALHEGIRRVLNDLSDDAFDWQPGPDMNSIAVLVVHLTGAERYWIGDVAAQEPSGRVRSEEFEVTRLSADQLRERLDNSLAYARTAVAGFTTADLDRPCQSQRDGQNYTLAWALLHALEHTAQHTGHIELTRQLWQQHTPSST